MYYCTHTVDHPPRESSKKSLWFFLRRNLIQKVGQKVSFSSFESWFQFRDRAGKSGNNNFAFFAQKKGSKDKKARKGKSISFGLGNFWLALIAERERMRGKEGLIRGSFHPPIKDCQPGRDEEKSGKGNVELFPFRK